MPFDPANPSPAGGAHEFSTVAIPEWTPFEQIGATIYTHICHACAGTGYHVLSFVPPHSYRKGAEPAPWQYRVFFWHKPKPTLRERLRILYLSNNHRCEICTGQGRLYIQSDSLPIACQSCDGSGLRYYAFFRSLRYCGDCQGTSVRPLRGGTVNVLAEREALQLSAASPEPTSEHQAYTGETRRLYDEVGE
jgi:hypothetical protein